MGGCECEGKIRGGGEIDRQSEEGPILSAKKMNQNGTR